MLNPAQSAIGFILGILFNFYATIVAARFVMQWMRADYHNPFSQMIVSLTNPVLVPLRRIIPSIRKYDTASLILCFAVLFLKLLIFKVLALGPVAAMGSVITPAAASIVSLLIVGLLDVIHQLFNVFIFALILQAILSWLPQGAHHPILGLLEPITSPVVRPLRNILPPIGGLDLSVFFTIIGLFAIRIFLIGSLQNIFGIG